MKKFAQHLIGSEIITTLFILILIIPLFSLFKLITPDLPANETKPYTFNEPPENFVVVVNLVRPRYLWVNPETNILKNQIDRIQNSGLESTWLLSYDNLFDREIIDIFKNCTGEKGAFIEVSPKLAEDVGVPYQSDIGDYYYPNKVFLPAYTRIQRDKLINTYLKKYKSVFGNYPKSVGAWYIDSRTQRLLAKKGISAALTLSDQFETDSLSIWGKYLSFPYYPSSNYSLEPAKYVNNKIPIVNIQWAQRDPVKSYGREVSYSRQSLQANDYLANGYDLAYFQDLLNVYLSNKNTDFNQITIGLEIGQESYRYAEEYSKQLQWITNLKNEGKLKSSTMAGFAAYYKNKYPNLSPPHFLSKNNDSWFMNPNFRVWITKEGENYFIKDLRFYTNQLHQDHLYTDTSQLLTRRVEGAVDDLVRGEKLKLGESNGITFVPYRDSLYLNLDTKTIKITENGVFLGDEILIQPKRQKQPGIKIAALKVLKNFLDYISLVSGPIKYSKMEDKTVFGLMFKGNLFGLYGTRLGTHEFNYATSSKFITPQTYINKIRPW